MSHTLHFKPITDEDYFLIKDIYDYYIQHSTATFHTNPLNIHELKEFIFENHHLYPAYMISCDGATAGYCYLTYFKKREAYDRTAEVTIYLKPEFCSKDIGHKALEHLEKEAHKRHLKNLVALITGNNFQSIKLFEKVGYTKVAHFKNIGEKMGEVLDVLAYQKEI